jgi:hypothetical protein
MPSTSALRLGQASRWVPNGWNSGPPDFSISKPPDFTSRLWPAMLGVHQRASSVCQSRAVGAKGRTTDMPSSTIS